MVRPLFLILLGGLEKQSSGTILYENNPYEKEIGMVKSFPKTIYFTLETLGKTHQKKTVSAYIADKFGKKKKVIANRYFNDGSFKNLLHRTIKTYQMLRQIG